jgi:hypothetical protein
MELDVFLDHGKRLLGAQFSNLAPLYGDLARHVALERHRRTCHAYQVSDEFLIVSENENVRLLFGIGLRRLCPHIGNQDQNGQPKPHANQAEARKARKALLQNHSYSPDHLVHRTMVSNELRILLTSAREGIRDCGCFSFIEFLVGRCITPMIEFKQTPIRWTSCKA